MGCEPSGLCDLGVILEATSPLMFHMDFCVVLAKQSHIQLHEDVMSLRGVGVLGLRLLSAEPVWHPADVAGSP